jgi:nitrite reductase/ring-hydroxylating ferredoxin subunit
MQRRPVCAIEDLPPGSMKLVQAGKFGVGVYNIDGSLYAIANYCSHEGAPLCAGYVGGTNEFDITTGINLADPRKRVRSYEVDVTDGQVYLTA